MSEKVVSQVSFVIESDIENGTNETLDELVDAGVLEKDELFEHYENKMREEFEESLDEKEELRHFSVNTEFITR
jgi:hypothetical protein